MVDVDVSNGTCYFAQYSVTNGDFRPCGNAALGNWPCCKTGDVCLGFDTANACYDADSANTYVAGCTDELYVDSTCPQKLGFADQEWVAIQHCGTTSSGDTNWGGCKNVPANDTALTKIPNSSCDPYCTLSIPLWVGAASIEAFATMPASAGGYVTWVNDFSPETITEATATPSATTSPSPSATTSSSSSTVINSAIPSPTSVSFTPTPTSTPTTTGLDTGAKAGIGIGSVGAVFLLVAVILFALFVRRRSKKRQQANVSLQNPGIPGYDTQSQSKPGPNTGGSYTEYKYELPADNQGQQQAFGGAMFASPHLSTISPDHLSASNASTLTTGYGGSVGYVSPQSTGTGGRAGSYNGRGESGVVSEMQG